jgi:pSer/pThr/pTyr-binding forkhead associated (FHA) protein
MRATLVPLDGAQLIEIVKEITVVGRQELCDVRLEHSSVSKVHLMLVKMDGALLFRDLGSTNGTKVNGQRVVRGALLPNDKLTIAACKFRVQLAADAAASVDARTEEIVPLPGSAPAVRVLLAKDLARADGPGEHANGKKRAGGASPAKE